MRNLEWDEPAKLFFWPAPESGHDDALFPSLWEALEAAGEGDPRSAWIITENGDILTPRMIQTLREKPRTTKRRRSGAAALFGWASA